MSEEARETLVRTLDKELRELKEVVSAGAISRTARTSSNALADQDSSSSAIPSVILVSRCLFADTLLRSVGFIGRKSVVVVVVERMEMRLTLSSRRNDRSKFKLAMIANIILDPSRTKQMFIFSLSEDPGKNEERMVAHVIMDKQR